MITAGISPLATLQNLILLLIFKSLDVFLLRFKESMMQGLIKAAPLFLLTLLSVSSFAKSIAEFPPDFREWVIVNKSFNIGTDVKLPDDTPLFIQKTVAMYSWVNDGKGSEVTVYVHPEKIEQYRTHGPYSDGPTVVSVTEQPGIVFVTEHLAGFPIYGTYDTQGKDISDHHPSFNVSVCSSCHEEFEEICINGTCGDLINPIFK